MKLLLFGFAVLLLGCKSQIKQPERPTDVPDKAFWIGGIDGGTWFLIQKVDSNNISAFIKVYNDQTGELIVSKCLSCSAV